MGAVTSLINTYRNRTIDVPQFTVVEHTTIKPKSIGGEDAAVFTTLVKTSIDNLTKSLNVGTRNYTVIHNGITYPFSFADDPAKFDNPENIKTRERMLNSIRFTNETTR
jgi:hypothetical protein